MCIISSKMGVIMKSNKHHRCQNLIACRIPILLIVVCFLIIANTRCDSVGGSTVQKFHPNGRYGRRSVNDFAEPASAHAELGRLSSSNVGFGSDSGGSPQRTRYDRGVNSRSTTSNNNKFLGGSSLMNANEEQFEFAPGGSNYQLELNKLLKCNYTGISNLYWCDNGTN